MTMTSASFRSIQQRVLRLAHPLIDSVLPVTYTAREFEEKKRRLDPDRARNRREPNPRTDERLHAILRTLDVEESDAASILEEARVVQLHSATKTDQPDLASPMCFEDRYAVYAVTRALAPDRVVETGIAHGVSSTYVLAALNAAERTRGTLVSIDSSTDPRIGQMVPSELRDRWTMHIGNSLELLPKILANLGTLDLFIHDSCHHYRHVRSEFDCVWPHLRPGGVLMAHDILQNNAFPRFLRRRRKEIEVSFANVNIGLIRKRRA